MPVYIDINQGTEDWHMARLGIPTSSQFNRIITPSGERSKQWAGYADDLIVDWLANAHISEYESKDMKRGKDQEDEARANYEFDTGNLVRQIGFIYLDERKNVGTSPDGLVNNDGMVELKNPKGKTMLSYYRAEEAPGIYRPQIQGQLWIAERKWNDLYCYHRNMKPFMIRVYREEEYIDALAKMVEKFNEYLEERKKELERWRVNA